MRSGWASAVCVGDYNNSGHDDLFVTYWGQSVLYRNNGDGTFTDVTQDAGLARSDVRWGPAALSSTTTVTGIWTCSLRTTWNSTSSRCPCQASRRFASGRASPSYAVHAGSGVPTTSCIGITATAHLPM